MGVRYRNRETGEVTEVAEPSPEFDRDRNMQRLTDDRTVLHALPEDQPDSLSEGHVSNQADLDATPAEKAAGTTRKPDVSDEASASDDEPATSAETVERFD